MLQPIFLYDCTVKMYSTTLQLLYYINKHGLNYQNTTVFMPNARKQQASFYCWFFSFPIGPALLKQLVANIDTGQFGIILQIVVMGSNIIYAGIFMRGKYKIYVWHSDRLSVGMLVSLFISLPILKKSHIRETPTLSTDADSRTDKSFKRLCNFFYFFYGPLTRPRVHATAPCMGNGHSAPIPRF